MYHNILYYECDMFYVVNVVYTLEYIYVYMYVHTLCARQHIVNGNNGKCYLLSPLDKGFTMLYTQLMDQKR